MFQELIICLWRINSLHILFIQCTFHPTLMRTVQLHSNRSRNICWCLFVLLHLLFCAEHSITYQGVLLQIGKGVVRRGGKDVAFLGYGATLVQCLEAATMLQKAGVSATVADMRFCKPLDTGLIRQLAKEHSVLITVEEGSVGGFFSHVSTFLALDGLLDKGLKIRPMTLPDKFIEHGSQNDQLAEAGLSSYHVAATAMSLLGKPKEALLYA